MASFKDDRQIQIDFYKMLIKDKIFNLQESGILDKKIDPARLTRFDFSEIIQIASKKIKGYQTISDVLDDAICTFFN